MSSTIGRNRQGPLHSEGGEVRPALRDLEEAGVQRIHGQLHRTTEKSGGPGCEGCDREPERDEPRHDWLHSRTVDKSSHCVV